MSLSRYVATAQTHHGCLDLLRRLEIDCHFPTRRSRVYDWPMFVISQGMRQCDVRLVGSVTQLAGGCRASESTTSRLTRPGQCCCSLVPASCTQSCQRFQKLGGQSGAQERHCGRLHDIEQLWMKSRRTCLFLASQGTDVVVLAEYACRPAGLLARVQVTSNYSGGQASIVRCAATRESTTHRADALSVSGRSVVVDSCLSGLLVKRGRWC